MGLRNLKVEGIILKRQNLSEADRLLTVFTKYHGKIRCIAPGVRKPTSRKAGHVELFDRTSLYLAKGKSLDLVTQAEVIERFPKIRNHLKAAKAAYHVVELVDSLTAENQENNQIYLELISIFRIINAQQQATQKQIVDFEKCLLTELGFGVPKMKSVKELHNYIESIIEKNLATVKTFKDV